MTGCAGGQRAVLTEGMMLSAYAGEFTSDPSLSRVQGDAWLRRHYTLRIEGGVGRASAKRSYATDAEAISVAALMNSSCRQVRKAVAYKCPVCHMWHVGRSRRTLTDDERERYSRRASL